MDLIEDLDPEQAREIIDPALVLMIDAVHRYEGYVVQSTGDGVFALFGAPVAYEDHPQRALYAALKMQEDLRKYAARLRQAGNPPVEIRVGINTGEAVIRSIRTDAAHTEYTPIGHSMSLAARMQTLAPSGAIVIADETRKLVTGYFTLNSLGPARVKGASEPIEVFEVTGLGALRTRLQRSASRGLSRFVGRAAELAQMKRIAELARGGHGQLVAAVAEAGVGKSRLFHEFKQTSHSGWLVLEAFSVSHGRATSYLPIVDLLRGYFHIESADSDRVRREKITGKILALDRALEDTLPFVFALIGVEAESAALEGMDAGVRRRRTQDAIKRILLRESRNQPLMMVVEDLHWIDDESQALLNLLADAIASARVLLLVNYRPEYRHDWGGRTHYTQLRLDPLGPEIAREMLDALIGDDVDLRALKSLIIERTEGNPFFMEEMVMVLFEQGVLVRTAAVKLAKPLESIQVPATVKGILAARIDRLSVAQKDLLQTLAVIGKEFALELVRHVTGLDAESLAAMLTELQAAEFIYEQPSLSDVEYTFKHALTQEVAYDSVLQERRRQIHERTAAAIEALFPTHIEDLLDALADHYGKSGNTEKAIAYFGRAAEQARARSAYEDAIRYLNSALELVATTPDTPARVRIELGLRAQLGAMFMSTRGYLAPELESTVRSGIALLERLGDSPDVIPILHGLWGLEYGRGRLFTASELARRIENLAVETKSPSAIAAAAMAAGSTDFWMGKLESARENLELARRIYDADLETFLPSPDAAVIPTHSQLAWLMWALGYPDRASDLIDELIALGRRLNRPNSLAMALQFAIAIGDLLGDAHASQTRCEELLEVSMSRGFPQWIGGGEMSLGAAMINAGDYDKGHPILRRGLEGLKRSGGGLVYGYGLILLARACLAMRRFDEGLAALDECARRFESDGARMYEAELHRLRGEMILQSGGNPGPAADSIRTAIAVARAQKAKSWELRAATSLAALLARTDSAPAARAALAPVYESFTEGHATRDLKDAKALLDRLGR